MKIYRNIILLCPVCNWRYIHAWDIKEGCTYPTASTPKLRTSLEYFVFVSFASSSSDASTPDFAFFVPPNQLLQTKDSFLLLLCAGLVECIAFALHAMPQSETCIESEEWCGSDIFVCNYKCAAVQSLPVSTDGLLTYHRGLVSTVCRIEKISKDFPVSTTIFGANQNNRPATVLQRPRGLQMTSIATTRMHNYCDTFCRANLMKNATPQEFCSFMTEPIRREAKSRGQLSSTTVARLTKRRSDGISFHFTWTYFWKQV